MILCEIKDLDRYCGTSPVMPEVISWLHAYLDGDDSLMQKLPEGVGANCETVAMKPREKATLEAHRRFIDIHVPLKGDELMGWAPTASLRYPRGTYDAETDCEFFGDTAVSLLHVVPGQAAVFFPEDAHAPNIGIGNHKKLVIKIPV